MKAEGIFRITAENSQEAFVRDQLNKGVVPHGIDVHCLSGLIKVFIKMFNSTSLHNYNQLNFIWQNSCVTLPKSFGYVYNLKYLTLLQAWFRELPTGVLDSLTPEQVMQCNTEDDCTNLVKLLPSTEAALLDWAINLMADVVENEQFNKMNARNVAMVFAPNMTQVC